MRSDRWGALVVLGLGLVMALLDQVSKMLVQQNLGSGGPGQVEIIGDWLRFSYTTNTGAAFGILPNATWLFTIVTLIAIPLIFLAQRYVIEAGWPVTAGLGLLLGGALGNVIDRLRFGYVIDFIDAGIGNLRWYTFNIADSSYVVGILILAAYLLFFCEIGKSKDSQTDHAA